MTTNRPWTQLQEHRKARGLTSTELADLAGISRTHMYYLEHGERWPSDNVIIKLARDSARSPQHPHP